MSEPGRSVLAISDMLTWPYLATVGPVGAVVTGGEGVGVETGGTDVGGDVGRVVGGNVFIGVELSPAVGGL